MHLPIDDPEFWDKILAKNIRSINNKTRIFTAKKNLQTVAGLRTPAATEVPLGPEEEAPGSDEFCDILFWDECGKEDSWDEYLYM